MTWTHGNYCGKTRRTVDNNVLLSNYEKNYSFLTNGSLGLFFTVYDHLKNKFESPIYIIGLKQLLLCNFYFTKTTLHQSYELYYPILLWV